MPQTMPQIVIEDSLSRQLDGFSGPVDLCDASGRVLGRFVPTDEFDYQQAVADGCPYTEEELREARREQGGISLAEFWRKMGRQ